MSDTEQFPTSIKRLKASGPESRLSILVVTQWHIGDLIQTFPALRDLRNAYPQAHITAFINSFPASLLEGCPYIDRVVKGFDIDYNKTPLARLRFYWRAARTFLAPLKRFDMVIMLTPPPRSILLLSHLAGARKILSFEKGPGSDLGRLARLLTHNLGVAERTMSDRLRSIAPLQALGIPTSPHYDPISWISESAKEQTRALLARYGVSGPYVVFHPGCHWGCNEWEDERWAELGDLVQEQIGSRIVITGTQEEFPKARRIVGMMKKPAINLTGRTSLLDFVNCITGAQLLVGVDGAQTQIALAQKTPAVILFGADSPIRIGLQPGEKMAVVRRWAGPDFPGHLDPHCHLARGSCHHPDCRAERTLSKITVADVWAEVQRVIGDVKTFDVRRSTFDV